MREKYRSIREFTNLCLNRGIDPIHCDLIIDLKRSIRRINRANSKDYGRYIYISDSSYWEIVDLGVDDFETAEDIFECDYYRECRPSMYDCTGDHFTISHKFTRNSMGNIQLWHYIGIDW